MEGQWIKANVPLKTPTDQTNKIFTCDTGANISVTKKGEGTPLEGATIEVQLMVK